MSDIKKKDAYFLSYLLFRHTAVKSEQLLYLGLSSNWRFNIEEKDNICYVGLRGAPSWEIFMGNLRCSFCLNAPLLGVRNMVLQAQICELC